MKTESTTPSLLSEPGTLSAKLQKVKKALVRRFSEEFSGRLPLALIRRAVEEADELAQSTGYPHLVLPLLAEETVRRVSNFSYSDEPASEGALAVA